MTTFGDGMSSTSTDPCQRTKLGNAGHTLTGPVVHSMAADSTPGIAALDARWAALVLAGQAADYAVQPGPGEALADVLEMLGLTGWGSA